MADRSTEKLYSAIPLTREDVTLQRSSLFFKVNNFDLVRLFAALQVAIVHTYYRFNRPLPVAIEPLSWFPGVPIFFVVSGYLISASFERSASLGDYARNRALRIFPGLWGVLTLTVVALALFRLAEATPRFGLWFLAQCVGLIYTPRYLAGFGDGTYNGSLWTIPIELQFYMLLPIVFALMRHSRIHPTLFLGYLTITFIAIGGLIAWIFPELGVHDSNSFLKVIRYTFVPRFYMFLFGALLQLAATYRSSLVRGRGLYWLGSYAVLRNILPEGGLWYMVGELSLGVTAISLAYTLPTLSERLLRGADISYGVYLYHGLVIAVMIELTVPPTIALPLTMAVSLVLASLSWRLIERPALRNKALRSWRRNPAAGNKN